MGNTIPFTCPTQLAMLPVAQSEVDSFHVVCPEELEHLNRKKKQQLKKMQLDVEVSPPASSIAKWYMSVMPTEDWQLREFGGLVVSYF